MFSDIPNPPPELLELRLKLREVLANIGYCMAAGMGTDEQVLRHDLSVKFPDQGTDARLAALATALESIAKRRKLPQCWRCPSTCYCLIRRSPEDLLSRPECLGARQLPRPHSCGFPAPR